MNKIKYFMYDNDNNINCNNIELKEFYYDEKTLIWNFYKELLQVYVDLDYSNINDIEEMSSLIYFKIIDVRGFRIIDNSIKDVKFTDLIHDFLNQILLVIPMLPIGGTMAVYRNIKIIIHSNEDNHLNFPHVHVIGAGFDDIFINLNNFEIVEGSFKDNKTKKKIINYITENQQKLLNYYNDVINHRILDKVVKDIIL